jgi:dienelactone hydrolase
LTVPEGFASTSRSYLDQTRTVFRAGGGPAVIVISEMPGITPQVAQFGRTVAAAGFSGYTLREVARACISREFRAFASHASSPIVDWLRALGNDAHREQGGKGVGAVGMCFTGNFALAMMLGTKMLAPVLSQPSLPLAFDKAGLHVSDAEIAAAKQLIAEDGARILGLRFLGDPVCRAERFQRLSETFGEAFEAIELDPACANPAGPKMVHSVLTNHLIDEAGQPTRAALDRVLEFLGEQLK